MLEFVSPSNETLPSLTEYTMGVIERRMKRSKGKIKLIKARLQDETSLGTAVEAHPSRWRDRFSSYVVGRDLINKIALVAALGVLVSVSTDFVGGLWTAAVGIGVSIGVSLLQATLQGRSDIEWRVR